MTKPVRIIRATHDSKFFAMSRQTAQDRSLSWEARGVLCYLLSKPDDWEIQPKDLEQGCAHGKVYKLLKELRAARYIKLIKVRDDQQRMTSYFYEVYETAFVEETEDEPFAQNQQVDEPLTEIRQVAHEREPLAEIPQAVNRHITYNRKEQSTEKGSSEAVATLSDLDFQAYRRRYDFYHAFEAGFPADAQTKVADTKANQNNARDLFLAGYTLEEITALVQNKLGQGKADYRFQYLMSDLAQARLEKNPPAKKAPPEVINAGQNIEFVGNAVNQWAREEALAARNG